MDRAGGVQRRREDSGMEGRGQEGRGGKRGGALQKGQKFFDRHPTAFRSSAHSQAVMASRIFSKASFSSLP